MARVVPYEASYSFSGWQATSPQKPLPAPPLDNELARIELAIRTTQEGLADIRREDGKLRDGVVTSSALSAELQTGIQPAELWVSGNRYAAGDTVSVMSAFYRCLAGHVSNVFVNDLAAKLWAKFADLGPLATDTQAARDQAVAAASTAASASATSVGAAASAGQSALTATDAASIAVSAVSGATAAWASLPAAPTATLASQASSNIRVTGSGVTITSFGSASDGVTKTLLFDAGITLKHQDGSIRLFGAADIVTQAGDIAVFKCVAPSTWLCADYSRRAGAPAWDEANNLAVPNRLKAGAVEINNAADWATLSFKGPYQNIARIVAGGDSAKNELRIDALDRTTNAFVRTAFFIDLTTGDATGTSNITAYSDERLKKDWAGTHPHFVERLAETKSGSYTRIDTGERQIGVSAQALRGVMPEAVKEHPDGVWSVAYGNAALVAAVELARRVVDLEARISALEAAR